MNAGSIAARAGLQAGDAVLQINGRPSDELEHEQAKREIITSGNKVFLVVQRYALAFQPTAAQTIIICRNMNAFRDSQMHHVHYSLGVFERKKFPSLPALLPCAHWIHVKIGCMLIRVLSLNFLWCYHSTFFCNHFKIGKIRAAKVMEQGVLPFIN